MNDSKQAGGTEQRIMQLIADHALKHPGKKLLKAELAAAAGITRQALHRYYAHLEPYISGEKSITERLDDDGKNAILVSGLERLASLEHELDIVKSGRDEEIERVRTEYITSLMKSDLALHDVDGLRSRLEAQSIHNDILINQIKSLEVQLTTAKLEKVELPDSGKLSGSANVRGVDVKLRELFASYLKLGDRARLDAEKVKAVQAAVDGVVKTRVDASVVLFIERYLCSFDDFCKKLAKRQGESCVVIQVPIFGSLQLRTLILSKLSDKTPYKIFVPYCTSSAVAKAQRAFYFSHVPEHEIESADKMRPISISDTSATEVVQFIIEQGT